VDFLSKRDRRLMLNVCGPAWTQKEQSNQKGATEETHTNQAPHHDDLTQLTWKPVTFF
jgi:hypothetical protein